MNTLIFGVCILAVAFATPVTFKDCGSVSGKLQTVDVVPCPSEPCQLKHGTNVTMNVKFTSDVDGQKAKTVVHGIIAGIHVPFPLPNEDACSAKNIPCPFKNGQDLTYSNQIAVLTSYPKLSLVIQWELQDQQGKDLFCFAIPAVITD